MSGVTAAPAGKAVGTNITRTTSFEHWHGLISGTTVPIAASTDRHAAFRGSMEAQLIDDVALVRTESVPQSVSRTQQLCRTGSEPMVKVLVQRRGRALIEQNSRQSAVTDGYFTVYDTAAPYTLTQTTDFGADVVLIPRSRLPITMNVFEVVQQKPVSTRRGPGEIFLSHLDSFLRQSDACSPNVASRCVSVLIELLAATLTELPTKSLSADAMRESAIRWIDRHLSDPDLDPAQIAAATGISVRYLHRLFEGSGTTVSSYIRSKRMQRIRADLLDPSLRDLTITRIGARWGTPDSAHLSRLFRKEFGCSPSDIRRW